MGTRIKQYKLPEKIDENIAKIYGHLISDGYLYPSTYRIIYCNTEMDLMNDFVNCFERIFDIKRKILHIPTLTKTLFRYELYSKVIWEYFNSFDINQILFTENKKIRKAFLQACFDDEGSVSKKVNTICICQKDKKYVDMIGSQLRYLGILSIPYKCSGIHYLRIFTRDNRLFKEEIGFIHPKKKEMLDNFLLRKGL